MTTTQNKRGRKQIPHVTKYDGSTIDGLYKCHDGRWRVNATGQKFTEPDERLAVARFHQLTSGKGTAAITVKAGEIKGRDKLATSVSDDARQKTLDEGLAIMNMMEAGVGALEAMEFAKDQQHLAPSEWLAKWKIPEPILWAYVREQIRTRPKYVAQQTGIEQIAYLDDLKEPTPSPTLEQVGELYFTKSKITPGWLDKCKQFWREFRESVDVTTLRELTQEKIVEYSDETLEAGETGTYARQRFGAIKTIINFAPKRGLWAEDSARALALCKVLVKPQRSNTDPKPIEKADFHKLVRKANAEMRAILLLALNCCMYGGEVAAIQWKEVDLAKGTLVTRRNKSGILRIAMLWPETIAALKALPRTHDHVFVTEIGTPSSYLIVNRDFKKLRKECELPAVQFAQIRDGAYTAAIDGGADLNHCKLLAGHSTGISDHYVQRKASMVTDACREIGKAYGPFPT